MMSGLRKAGRLFGLDLASLFDDNGEATEGDFAPSLQFQTTSKGRGQALYLRPQQQSAVTTTLNLIPREQKIEAPSELPAPQLPPTVEPESPVVEPEEPERKSLRDIAYEYGASALFGHQDYKKALQNYGYDRGEVQSYLKENPYLLAASNRPGQAGGLYEEIAGDKVDLSKAISRDYAQKAASFQPSEGQGPEIQAFRKAQDYAGSPQISAAFGQSADYFGDEDLKAARMSGYDDSAIKSFLEKNLDLVRGPNAPGGASEIGQMLSGSSRMAPKGGPGMQKGPVSDGKPGIGTGAGASAEYFGHADVDAAKAAGASNEAIARFIASNQDKLRGGNVRGGGGLFDEYAKYM